MEMFPVPTRLQGERKEYNNKGTLPTCVVTCDVTAYAQDWFF